MYLRNRFSCFFFTSIYYLGLYMLFFYLEIVRSLKGLKIGLDYFIYGIYLIKNK